MSDLNKYDGAIRTFFGNKISITDTRNNKYNIVDIAKGLAYKGHFGGQTPYFFSIAQHCIMVDFNYKLDCIMRGVPTNPIKRLVCLLHDASEAYMGDNLKPYKLLMPDWVAYETKLSISIFKYFEIPMVLMADIKPYDIKSQELEYQAFRGTKKVMLHAYNPETALDEFLKTYWNIINEIITDENNSIRTQVSKFREKFKLPVNC